MNMCLPQNTEVNMYSEAFVNGMLEAYEAAMKSMLKAKYVSEVLFFPGMQQMRLQSLIIQNVL